MLTDDKARQTTEDSVSNYHTGGGWYDLPNGERVRGKDNAIGALKEMDK